jgi:hypothetical protein
VLETVEIQRVVDTQPMLIQQDARRDPFRHLASGA